MSTLHLTLKKRWFDMIASGEKKEEYREIKPYWISRFFANEWVFSTHYFKQIVFRNGYAKGAPSLKIECKGIEIGTAKPEWSENWPGEVFVIKLGEIIKEAA